MRSIQRNSRNTQLVRGRWGGTRAGGPSGVGELWQIFEDVPPEPELPEELLEPPELLKMKADVDEPETGLGTLEDEESEPDWQTEQRDAPAALRKLRNSRVIYNRPTQPHKKRRARRRK